MIKTKHLSNHSYLFFIFLCILGAIGLMLLPKSTLIQFYMVGVLCIAMVIWAMFHHSLDKSLNWKVMLEYVLIAALILIIMAGLVR